MFAKVILAFALIVGYTVFSTSYIQMNQISKTEEAMHQLDENGHHVQQNQLMKRNLESNGYVIGWVIVACSCFLIFLGDLKKMASACLKKTVVTTILIGLLSLTGCWKPFEPVKLEVIKSNEEAFLLPLTGDGKKQAGSDNEEYLKSNLVYSKQVQIPQQWVQLGYETMGYNGEWRDAALIIKVDKSPVTREWTADPNTGTSDKNEAIWVMTSDQVEFSTGWTITARISGRDDAVKFLHNYPNGSLQKVLDSEVRSKIQAEFGLEVTDLPMDELRKNATPHILKTTKNVTDFFKQRGITITNLGITGGFIYKDKTIIETMVKVFNAEQERSIAVAATNAQQERNKAVILKAQGEADALMKTKKAEADGIRMVAEARNYELEKAKQDMLSYMKLKQLELQKELLGKWNGAYPHYFMGGASSPNMLLSLPQLEAENTKGK